MYMIKSGGPEQARLMVDSCFELVGSHKLLWSHDLSTPSVYMYMYMYVPSPHSNSSKCTHVHAHVQYRMG